MSPPPHSSARSRRSLAAIVGMSPALRARRGPHRHHPRQFPADPDRDPAFRAGHAGRCRASPPRSRRSSPTICAAAGCSRRSIRPPISRRSPTSTRCRNFESWRVINAQALVTGRVRREAARIKADFRLWDVLAGQQLTGQQYNTTAENTRRVAHIISDAIYTRITGETGLFRQPRGLRRRDRRRRTSASSGSRSWIRTAPACAISPAATISC